MRAEHWLEQTGLLVITVASGNGLGNTGIVQNVGKPLQNVYQKAGASITIGCDALHRKARWCCSS